MLYCLLNSKLCLRSWRCVQVVIKLLKFSCSSSNRPWISWISNQLECSPNLRCCKVFRVLSQLRRLLPRPLKVQQIKLPHNSNNCNLSRINWKFRNRNVCNLCKQCSLLKLVVMLLVVPWRLRSHKNLLVMLSLWKIGYSVWMGTFWLWMNPMESDKLSLLQHCWLVVHWHGVALWWPMILWNVHQPTMQHWVYCCKDNSAILMVSINFADAYMLASKQIQSLKTSKFSASLWLSWVVEPLMTLS